MSAVPLNYLAVLINFQVGWVVEASEAFLEESALCRVLNEKLITLIRVNEAFKRISRMFYLSWAHQSRSGSEYPNDPILS